MAASVSTSRILIGGLAAGIVMNACDWVTNNYILAREWQRLAQSYSLDMSSMGGNSALATFVAIDLLLGLLVVWNYAAVRPRLGPGPGTAFISACTIFAAQSLVTATYAGWLIPWDLFVRSAGLQFVSVVAGGLAGAWVYQEDGD